MRQWVDRLLGRYARVIAATIRPFIVGERVLDLGAGEGYVGDALRGGGVGWVCGVDVGGFRRGRCPYIVYDGVRLPFGAGAFDTTLLLLTLHHCAEPARVLAEATRVTRHRVIVTESVARNRLDRFWLDLLDGRLNRYRHQGAMSPARHFKSAPQWSALFQAQQLRLAHQQWLGSRWERLVHHPLLVVLDTPAARSA